MEHLHRATYPVRSFETDMEGRAQLATLVNFLQESAADHARQLGAGFEHLSPRNLIWVLSRYHLRLSRYPLSGDTVEVLTWPSAREGLFALREFEVRDSSGREVAVGTSSWMLLNLESKRPVRPAQHLPEYPIEPRRALPDDFPSLPTAERYERELPFRVRRSDIDLNRHVNHAVYVGWAVETVPPEILEGHRVAELEASFRAEAFYGERVFSRVSRQEDSSPVFLHQLPAEGDGRELTRLRTRWEAI